MIHGKLKIETETQRNQREAIREIEIFTLEKKYSEILEKNGMTKIIIEVFD
jgi:hypothetical protein